MMSDTRTNAGIDNISIYRKMHVLADSDDRLILCMSAGNLSVTQHVLGQLAEGLHPLHEEDPPRRILDMGYIIRDCAADPAETSTAHGPTEFDLTQVIAAARLNPTLAAAAS